jgi:Cys-tRNA synthase (O-phospho-L-seryl-tRNA:Cys-tRNA synthase)
MLEETQYIARRHLLESGDGMVIAPYLDRGLLYRCTVILVRRLHQDRIRTFEGCSIVRVTPKYG